MHVHKRVPVERLPSSGYCTNLIINQSSYKMKNVQSWRIGSILRKGISNYLKKKKKGTELRNSSPWMKLEVWRKWPLTAVGSRRKRQHGNFMWFLGMALVDFSRDKSLPFLFLILIWSYFSVKKVSFRRRNKLLRNWTIHPPKMTTFQTKRNQNTKGLVLNGSSDFFLKYIVWLFWYKNLLCYRMFLIMDQMRTYNS